MRFCSVVVMRRLTVANSPFMSSRRPSTAPRNDSMASNVRRALSSRSSRNGISWLFVISPRVARSLSSPLWLIQMAVTIWAASTRALTTMYAHAGNPSGRFMHGSYGRENPHADPHGTAMMRVGFGGMKCC